MPSARASFASATASNGGTARGRCPTSGPPHREELPIGLRYVSQHLRLRSGALGREKLVLIGACPGRPTGAGLLGYEDGLWLLTAFGYRAHRLPTDLAGLLESCARSSPDTSSPLSAKPSSSGSPPPMPPSNPRRRYERLRRFPAGLLVLGDGVCSVNPLYGQGMTVAAQQAVALRDALAAGERDLARRFFRAAAKPIDVAWRMAVGGDLALPEVPGPRPLAVRVFNAYTDRLLAAAEQDPVVADRFARVTNFLDPPTHLRRPDLLRRVLLGGAGDRPGTGRTSRWATSGRG